MKKTTSSEIPVGRFCALMAAAAVALVPFTQKASAALIYNDVTNVYGETFGDDKTIPGYITTLPAGYSAYTVSTGGTVTPLSNTISNQVVVNSNTGSVANGLYAVSSMAPNAGAGTYGLGTSGNNLNVAVVLEIQNNPAGLTTYAGVLWSGVFQAFHYRNQASDNLKFQYWLSPTPLSQAQKTGAVGWTLGDPSTAADLNFTSNNPTINVGSNPKTSNGYLDFVGDGDSWAPGEYLYLRWYDSATATSTDGRGIGLNYVGFVGDVLSVAVPEPSTWVAAGLLVGCVGFGSRRRKAASTLALA